MKEDERRIKKAVIVFTDEWLPYSPTVLNMLTCLKENGYQVRIVTLQSSVFRNFERFEGDIDSFNFPIYLQRILSRLHLYRAAKLPMFLLFYGRTIREAELCFSIDSLGFIVSCILNKKAYYVSLEAVRDVWFRMAQWFGIHHVAIQTKERFEFLFKDSRVPPSCWILPNSPIFEPVHNSPAGKHDLVYFGLISAAHGAESCLEAFQQMPESYCLTLKGPVHEDYMRALRLKYGALFESARLTFDPAYIPQDNVVPYLSRFSAGFCFYDFNIIARNDFNYISCPAGKLYSYLAAGVPIIGSDILGLAVVRERGCGLLLKDPSPRAIVDAITKIDAHYESYRERCLMAAKDFDFRTHFNQLLEKIDHGF